MEAKLMKGPIHIIGRLTAAHKEMCDAVNRQWQRGTALKISIPARPDNDSDLIVCGAIREAKSVIEELCEALESMLDVAKAEERDLEPRWVAGIIKSERALAKARGEGQ